MGAGWTGRQRCVQSRCLLLTSSASVRWLGLCQVAFGKKKVLSQMKKSVLIISASKSLQGGRSGIGGLGPGVCSSPRCPLSGLVGPQSAPVTFLRKAATEPASYPVIPKPHSHTVFRRSLSASPPAGSASHLSGWPEFNPRPTLVFGFVFLNLYFILGYS